MIISITGELWLWRSRSDTWTFLTVPADDGEVIDELHGSLPRRGFGSVRVEVEAGTSRWRTSIFRGADGHWVLPVKRAIRDAQGWELDDRVNVRVRLIDL